MQLSTDCGVEGLITNIRRSASDDSRKRLFELATTDSGTYFTAPQVCTLCCITIVRQRKAHEVRPSSLSISPVSLMNSGTYVSRRLADFQPRGRVESIRSVRDAFLVFPPVSCDVVNLLYSLYGLHRRKDCWRRYQTSTIPWTRWRSSCHNWPSARNAGPLSVRAAIAIL